MKPVLAVLSLLFGVLTSGLGCSNASGRVAVTVERYDSAGVEVVVSEPSTNPYRILDSLPDLSLGGLEVTGPTQFASIQRVVVGPGGGIWVADLVPRRIEVFDRGGRHLFGVGGQGGGPEDFR